MGSSPCLSQLSAATIEVALAHLEGPIVSTPSSNDSLSNLKTCAREPHGNDEKAHAYWIGPPYGRGGAQPLTDEPNGNDEKTHDEPSPRERKLELELELKRKLKLQLDLELERKLKLQPLERKL